MRNNSLPGRVAGLLLLLWSVAPTSTSAATYIRMTDAELADQSPLILAATVLEETTVRTSEGIFTDYLVQVDTLLKGVLPQPFISVRVLGGELEEEGIGLKVWGAPEYREGDNALLFLTPHPDGAYRIVQVALGAFRIVQGENRRLAVRDLEEAHELSSLGLGPFLMAEAEGDRVRDYDDFAFWLRERARGRYREAHYFVEPTESDVVGITEQFTLFTDSSTGKNLRWFRFDEDQPVKWFAHQSGQKGIPGGGFSQFQTALSAWNNDPDSFVRYDYAGTTSESTTSCASLPSNQARIVFNDPHGVIPGTFTGSGILAIGGACYSLQTSDFNGKSFHRIVRAFIVTQDGFESFFATDTNNRAGELFTHELGHTLGIGHSCGDSKSPPCSSDPVLNAAVMRASMHNPAMGAALTGDDRAAIAYLYSLSSGGGGCSVAAPSSPSSLSAVRDGSLTQLAWQQNSSNEEGFRVYRSVNGAAFSLRAEVGSGAASYLDGGLHTSFSYTYRVAAFNCAGQSGFSNQASVGPVSSYVPAAPTQLSASPVSSSRINLSWIDNSENEEEFRVEMRVGGVFVEIGSVPANTTVAVVTQLQPATAYTFRVRARNASGFSAYSNQAFATTLSSSSFPSPPGNLKAVPQTSSQILLSWEDSSESLLDLRLERRVGSGLFQEIAVLPPGVTSFLVSGLAARTSYGFRLRGRNASGFSGYSNIATASTYSQGSCVVSDQSLCLLEGRFKVEVEWRNQYAGGVEGVGQAVPRSDQTGFFWFFDPDNIELVVKVLDGRPLNERFWFFYGALSDVEYTVRVTDTVTSEVRNYVNPPGNLCGRADTEAFSGSSGHWMSGRPPERDVSSEEVKGGSQIQGLSQIRVEAPSETCTPAPDVLCLLDGRFEVRVDWRNPYDGGGTGVGKGIFGTDQSGFFWFFHPDNIELAVKVLDGRPINGRFWFFYGALSDVEYWITLKDTFSGVEKVYHNPPGNLCGVADTRLD